MEKSSNITLFIVLLIFYGVILLNSDVAKEALERCFRVTTNAAHDKYVTFDYTYIHPADEFDPREKQMESGKALGHRDSDALNEGDGSTL